MRTVCFVLCTVAHQHRPSSLPFRHKRHSRILLALIHEGSSRWSPLRSSSSSSMMRYLTATLAAAGVHWLRTSSAALPASLVRDGGDGSGDFNEFIAQQSGISLQGVLANIGPEGSKAGGAASGVVIASPSKQDPDCELSNLSWGS